MRRTVRFFSSNCTPPLSGFTLLVPAVVKSTWERDYPDDSYVGKSFYIRNEGKREGKRHIDFTVAEVDPSGLVAA